MAIAESLLIPSRARLCLPYPEDLPSRRSVVAAAMRSIASQSDVLASFGEPAARADLRARLTDRDQEPGPGAAARRGPHKQPGGRSDAHRPPGRQAEAEQQEHDRYFEVGRIAGDAADTAHGNTAHGNTAHGDAAHGKTAHGDAAHGNTAHGNTAHGNTAHGNTAHGNAPHGDAARGFAAGLILAHLSAYENCLSMGVTLLDDAEWRLLFGGVALLLEMTVRPAAPARGVGLTDPASAAPPRPRPAGWRDGYDPGERWLVGHRLFFTLIQGAIVGLNCFASAAAEQATPEAGEGLGLAGAFLRSSAAAMKLASDFAPADYAATVRPAMAPPKVRAGFSGLQTRDHAYLVRRFGALKPVLAALDGRAAAHEEFVESVVTAYAAHEFICARFRGGVLPSLRMAAASRGTTGQTGVQVIREMMRARLALVGPARPGRPASAARNGAVPAASHL